MRSADAYSPKKVKQFYPEIDTSSADCTCTLGRDNGNFFLKYEGYFKGTFTANPEEIMNEFRLRVKCLPNKIPLNLEDCLPEKEEPLAKLLLCSLVGFKEEVQGFRRRIEATIH